MAMTITNIMDSMVPISLFNKGEANRIFKEVQETGPKIVVKNNKPECILMAPEEYEALMDIIEDCRLYLEARKRLAERDPEKDMTMEEVMKQLGITEEDLEGVNVETE